jgi:hypothetical protein
MPLGPWIIVRNYNAFVDYITKNGIPAFVSFDHDLGHDAYVEFSRAYTSDKKFNYENVKERTGYECAKWLVEKCLDENQPFPNYQVHSMNPIGKSNIESYIESYIKSSKT